MKSASKVLAAAVAVALSSVAAKADLTVHYDTWPAVGGSVTNTGTTGTNGSLIVPGTESYPSGPDDGTLLSPNTGIHFNDGTGGGGNLSTGISSNQLLGSVIGTNKDFTMAAWVNLDDTNGDNMVFGTNGGNPMHLGFRGNSAYFGFWGNDSNSAGLNNITGTWNFFEWEYVSNGGLQNIYENGVLISSSPNHAGPGQTGETFTVGTNGANGGDLNGALDDVRVYNVSGLDAGAIYADASKPDAVPEPASIGLLGMGALSLLARRRRA